ncbi:hypothetical protein [Alicyclobacillus ferrooxydans]|uniref:Copper amine oxidase-like N-terminal domain-containing protein n=1 Tax=Alicyclobacillus ferrooxydans TaxID=471514 RepID=A0A0P9EWJ2_9BACL|nr:hypothetical protein [Alicyclobacillus ferrooxydans]KPV43473.1 hypothetical protein AN477_12260 [Alicyclobacillus ferrooxydans]
MNKITLAFASSTTIVAGVVMGFPSTALAAPSYKPYATHIYLDGKNISNPYHIVAKENATAQKPTSWIPIWYLIQALKSLNIQSTWDGETWNLQLPSGVNADLGNIPAQQTVNVNEMEISLNGTVVQYAPRIAYKDPGGNVVTSYAPIWYLMQVLKRVGIQYSWNGTDWTMNQATNVDKLDVVKGFITALHILPDPNGTNPFDDVPDSDWPYVHAAIEHGYFQPTSSTHFGSLDDIDMSTVDHAYQAYIGIPDSEMGWQAGGDLVKWSNIIGLNNGIGTSVPMFTADVAQMTGNLTRLFNGYYKDSSGSYHLVFKPYNAYPIYHTNKKVTESFVSLGQADAIRNIDGITMTNTGSHEAYQIPGLSSKAPEELTVGNIGIATSNTYFSLNHGGSWGFAKGFFGYDSRDPDNGGTPNPPTSVLVKDVGETKINAAQINQYDGITFGSVDITFDANGVPQFSYSSGAANQ